LNKLERAVQTGFRSKVVEHQYGRTSYYVPNFQLLARLSRMLRSNPNGRN